MGEKTFYITTPIYYPSNTLHLGHTLTTAVVDSMARYKKMMGYDVFFLTGSDEHGQKIERIASEKGVKPIEYTDKIVETFKVLWEKFNVNYDEFLRTTSDRHYKTVEKIFEKIFDSGDIYMSQYEGLYCTSCESYFTETQAVKNKCPDCGKELEVVKEESYFFKMGKYEERLLKHIEDNPGFIQPESRKNEMVNFIKQGLEDLCISRTTFDWGIPIKRNEGHVIYVWFDALTNYLTGVDYLEEGELYKKYWRDNDEIVHVVGKDILRFHTIIWPTMLMSAGIKIPQKVFGHGWLLSSGGKMSKSVGNVIDPIFLIDRYGADALRFFLLRELPYGSDKDYSEEAFVNRINVDLANDYGNLLSRTVSMVDKYFKGIVPSHRGEFNKDILDTVTEGLSIYHSSLENFDFTKAIKGAFLLIEKGNKYIEEQAPWTLYKEGKIDELGNLLYTLIELIRISTIMLSPILIESKENVKEQLGIVDDIYLSFEKSNIGSCPGGLKVKKGEPLFPRIDWEKEIKDRVKSLSNEKSLDSTNENTNKNNLITIDEFFKSKLKVGEVIEAKKVPKTDKLLELKVDLGEDKARTIVAGIAPYYNEENILGKKVIVVTNLLPAKLRGIESEGMLLAAKSKKKLSLVTIDQEISNGSDVG